MPKGYTKQELKLLHESMIGMRVGRLVVIRAASAEEEKNFNQGKHWLCQCDCGKKCGVRTPKLRGNDGRGDYKQYSCGCMSVITNFIARNKILTMEEEDIEWLYNFYKQDGNKFSVLHSAIVHTSGIKNNDWLSKSYYKECHNYFGEDEQFNKIYNFGVNNRDRNSTFYDLAKPSLDHKIPKSKGGSLTDYSNWQFLTVFENLAKRDMTQEEGDNFKRDNNTYSDYFYDSIRRL